MFSGRPFPCVGIAIHGDRVKEGVTPGEGSTVYSLPVLAAFSNRESPCSLEQVEGLSLLESVLTDGQYRESSTRIIDTTYSASVPSGG